VASNGSAACIRLYIVGGKSAEVAQAVGGRIDMVLANLSDYPPNVNPVVELPERQRMNDE
jgi:hypothetical protein